MNYLIAGLGNIGPEYELTRHNIGFLTLDRFAHSHNINFSTEKLAFKTEFKYKGRVIHLIKPTTYMNLSGKSVNYWMQLLKIPLENLLVICDDLNLPFGGIRMRPKGSSGGQNGLNSIKDVLDTEAYARLRMGIGNEFSKGRQADYVLSPFSKQEFAELPFVMDDACNSILTFCTEGVTSAMNKHNK